MDRHKAPLDVETDEKIKNWMLSVQEDFFNRDERLNMVMEISNSALWEYDVKTEKIAIGESFYRILGFDKSKNYNRYEIFEQSVNIEDRMRIKVLLTKVANGALSLLDSDCRFVDVDGEEHFVQLYGKVFEWNESGQALKISGMGRDVTLSKRMEAELKEAKEKAERDNLLKNIFIDNMSHELRTPMNAIMGFTDVVLAMELDDEQAEYLGFARSAADDLLGIIEEILAFSEIQSGGLRNVTAPFSMFDLMHKLVLDFKSKIVEKGLLFDCKYTSSFPIAVRADMGKVERILNVLLSNAVKFTKSGSVTIGLYVVGKEVTREGRTLVPVKIAVQDTGIGIPQDKLGGIFEGFTQVDNSSTRAYGGVGLGLTTAKGYAEIIDGDLTVESELGKGSCFTLNMILEVLCEDFLQAKGFDALSGLQVLCVEGHDDLGSEIGSVTEGEVDVPAETLGYKALVVEDNKLMFLTAKAYLAQYGVLCIPAYSGQEALKKLVNGKFDIIFMDIYMPEMDGYETTERIRAIEKNDNSKRHTPIVALSAEAMMSAKQKAIEVGMDAYISKPFKRSDIELVLNRYLFAKD